ncbi:MAG: 3-deoxy-8-phosphooctulonate synthase [Candidatus Poribacteria bacterium]|nr:3-deoxy-8-phosphooctulonate synthase [Candidatus Poribacteria bacterium]
MTGKTVQVRDIKIGGGLPLVLIAGPCVIEGRDHALHMAEAIKKISDKTGVRCIFKSSYDKANRSSIDSYRGPGCEKGLRTLEEVQREIDVPVLSDVHSTNEVNRAASILDVLQIPAFLCRQTDLLVAAGQTDKPVKIKKGQFMAPWDMTNVIEKIMSTGNEQILLTERGSSFGYNNLVVDMTSLPVMRKTGFPVVFDATHSVQEPGGLGKNSGGRREFVGHLARAAAAAGIDALFMEVHDRPDDALCDGPNMVDLDKLESILRTVTQIDTVVKTGR